MLLGLYGLGLFAVVLYFAQSDLPTVLGQGKAKPLEHGWPRLAVPGDSQRELPQAALLFRLAGEGDLGP